VGQSLGRALVVLGFLIMLIGAGVMWGGGRIPIGRLPGDIHIQRENLSFYFPLTTSLLISLLLSILLKLLGGR
jgi:hypothetical protein